VEPGDGNAWADGLLVDCDSELLMFASRRQLPLAEDVDGRLDLLRDDLCETEVMCRTYLSCEGGRKQRIFGKLPGALRRIAVTEVARFFVLRLLSPILRVLGFQCPGAVVHSREHQPPGSVSLAKVCAGRVVGKPGRGAQCGGQTPSKRSRERVGKARRFQQTRVAAPGLEGNST
jgi:hypothetical protein